MDTVFTHDVHGPRARARPHRLLEAFLEHLGSITLCSAFFFHFEPILASFFASWGHLSTSWKPLGAYLGPTWEHFGGYVGLCWVIFGHLGADVEDKSE